MIVKVFVFYGSLSAYVRFTHFGPLEERGEGDVEVREEEPRGITALSLRVEYVEDVPGRARS